MQLLSSLVLSAVLSQSAAVSTPEAPAHPVFDVSNSLAEE